MQVQIYSSPQPQLPRLFPPFSNPSPSTRSPSSSWFPLRPPPALLSPSSPPRSSRDSSSASSPFATAPTLLQEQVLSTDSDSEEEGDEGAGGARLVARRPLKDLAAEEVRAGGVGENGCVEEVDEAEELIPSSSASRIDAGLSEFAKKMAIFEPLERVGEGREERPLGVNLELWLYRIKVMTRNFQFDEAERILRKCIFFWPEDGRAYVALGKLLRKQEKIVEARLVYERGSQATQGENPYIWQCWAILEKRLGNIRRARELFDAATVADTKHVAAWHGWAILEMKQGNIQKARNLLGKGLKYCGANEYIYQTLALLEAKGKRIEQSRYFFQQATLCNPKSCASWLAWAQVEMQQENNHVARQLFEKAVQASPKNRFAWHVWALFEAKEGDIVKGRKLLKIGHTLNPRDPVILQSLALLEFKYSSANLARVLFRRASELDPKHQPVWIAWGWMEWKEGNISTARELYQRALSIDSTSESAARCLQAWGVLEQRLGNLTVARRLFRSSLNINSQSNITWMTWASLEEEQGNPLRAEEIRNLYFQQCTEVVDDASWVMGFSDIIDPAVDSIKRFLNFNQNSAPWVQNAAENSKGIENGPDKKSFGGSSILINDNTKRNEENMTPHPSDFDLDTFIKDRFSLDASELDVIMETSGPTKVKSSRRIWKSEKKNAPAQP
uniref:PsbB mRNA maturation factor Mbb1, chloroplastic n=2 Tax=Anthurium amnicola TaxID=1678845 RepID=A0A1D1YCP5_9ARAE